MEVQSTPIYKIRAILGKLRPLFLEVIGTPDFRNCKAAKEICKELEFLVDVHKQTIVEPSKQSRVSNQNSEFVKKPMESCSGKKKKMISGFHGHLTFVIGGSVSGWNFITFPGSKSVYYGVQKEMFRRNRRRV